MKDMIAIDCTEQARKTKAMIRLVSHIRGGDAKISQFLSSRLLKMLRVKNVFISNGWNGEAGFVIFPALSALSRSALSNNNNNNNRAMFQVLFSQTHPVCLALLNT